MRSGRSALGVIAGVLLGLGVVALAGPGLSLYGAQSASAIPRSAQTTETSVQFVTTTNSSEAAVINSVPGTAYSTAAAQNSSTPPRGPAPLFTFSGAGSVSPSRVSSIARQAINLTGFALLPIFAAFLFGFVLYRVSKARNEKEELPEPA